jgi:hypothetical protein
MASVLVSGSTPIMIIPASPNRGATIQNNSDSNIYIDWSGNPNVSQINNTNGGIRIRPGGYIDLPYLDNAVYAIGDIGSGADLDVRYILRRTK